MYLSYYKITTYLSCPYKYYKKFIEKIAAPISARLAIGRAVHEGLDYNYAQKVLTWEDLPPNVPLDVYSQVFENLAYQVEWTRESEERGALKDGGYSSLQLYYQNFVPQIFPGGVESKFTLQFTPTIFFSGRMDVFTREEIIIDTKTKDRTPSEEEIARNYQLTGYAMGYRALKKRLPAGLRLDYLIRLKKGPEVKIFTPERSEADIKRLIDTSLQVAKGIRSGVFPRNEESMFCSPQYCEYYRICKGGK